MAAIAGIRPITTTLNLGSTNASRAYIDKLAGFGTNLIISASQTGYSSTNFIFDGIRHGSGFPDNYPNDWIYVSNAVTGVEL